MMTVLPPMRPRALCWSTRQHIGMITGPIHSVHTLRRANASCRPASTAWPMTPLVRASDWDRDSGYRLGGELIRAGAKAIFAQNDLVGTGVIDWCNQNGIEVGRDIFLIGYDNREISSVCRPSLSTDRPAAVPDGPERGPHPADMLSGKHPAQKDIMLECTIIKREPQEVNS